MSDADAMSGPDTAISCALLLHLVSLPCHSTMDERQRRLASLQSWSESHPSRLSDLLSNEQFRDTKTGCMPLHWAAGTGFDEAIHLMLSRENCSSSSSTLEVDQFAHYPSTNRTPLHYAARNGHLSTCRILIEQYGATPNPKCGRGAVTPLQLAVWQNRLPVVQYLVQCNGTQVVHERNGFNCGLMHWIGLIPKKRWGGDIVTVDCADTLENIRQLQATASGEDGSGVLPLARYLHRVGITYDSIPENCNTQGHTPNHKAAWGGNLPLLQYFRDEHGVYDTVQDVAGYYCADLAKMSGNTEAHHWILEYGSGDRAESYKILGLELGADINAVKRRYWDLAKEQHPDRLHRHSSQEGSNNIVDAQAFLLVKAAYEHLTKENGIGKQCNPKFTKVKLLEDQRLCSKTAHSEDDLFIARLLALLSDYGKEGFPVSLIARRWNQIWPDRPFPNDYIIERQVQKKDNDCTVREQNAPIRFITIQKKTNLLKWLKWKCKGSDIYFRNDEGVALAFDRTMSKVRGEIGDRNLIDDFHRI